MRGPIERHRDRENWKHRRGRFAGLDEDTPDRPQIMPDYEPDEQQQTHSALADLTLGERDERLAGGDPDGA